VLLWGIVFSSHVTGTAGAAIMMTDVWYRFIRRPAGGALEGPAADQPFYGWVILYMLLSPLYVFATEWTPVGLVLAYGVISIMALPVITGMILWLTADRRTMGEHRNGVLTNALLMFTVAAAVWLTWDGLGDIVREMGGKR
jgi:Mn2+/Fe2+ NRAMP family transporter